MRQSAGENLFTIPPGVPFLKTLAAALCDGRLVDGFRADGSDPLKLAQATIFVPTRRAARALRSEFVDRLGHGSAILPVIRPLGEIDDDSDFFEAAVPAALDFDPPIGSAAALIELGQLILAWKRRLPKAVADFHSDNPLIAPANPADAIWLARGLADLLDAMETERRPWGALDELEAADHAAWWQLTLEFLKIASTFWPARLSELRRSNPAAHRNAMLRAQAERLSASPVRGPVIVAGSTGSLPATADLIAAVMRLEQGAVVLPGLDQAMDDGNWPLVGGGAPVRKAGTMSLDDPAIRAHPQYGLYRLLERLGRSRSEVVALAAPDETLATRQRVVSLALLPTAATAIWADRPVAPEDTRRGFSSVSLIEAANEREEAQAIAIAMRLALEEVDATAQVALVTPDRGLARRVAIELSRFGIEANDSAGTPLASTPQGGLLTLAVAAALEPGDPVALLALLKHPLARFGLAVGAARRAARILELTTLRSGTGEVDVSALTALFERRQEAAREESHAPLWRRRIGPGDLALARDLAGRVEAAVKPLADRLVRHQGVGAMTGTFSVASWACETGHVLEAVARDERQGLDHLWGGEAGEKLADLLSAVMESEAGLELSGPEWAAMLPALLAGETVKPRAGAHPRVFIWGALEARLQHVDTVVLAGLNEGTWPGRTANDPFLSRGMKAAIGLEPPERRIGQAAHDFEMALGAPRVVLSRAARSGTEPTVASRWLQRLLAVLGEERSEALRVRGRNYLTWAGMLDRGESVPLAVRPQPRPPRERQPTNYSFSEVKTLRRDPYAVYARRILKLEPIAEMVRDPSVAERGTLYHAILEEFTLSGVRASDPRALDRMREITARRFDEAHLPDYIMATWRPRFDRVAELFLEWERGREDEVAVRHVEARARMTIAPTEFSLSGHADRIDVLTNGTARIIDYKTGSSPSVKQARTLLDPQLALEAAVLKLGGFEALPATEPSELSYIRLKPETVLKVERVDNYKPGKPETRTASQLADEAINAFVGFLSELASGRRGFASRLIPASARDFGGEYDHLARVAEWATADGDDGEGGNG